MSWPYSGQLSPGFWKVSGLKIEKYSCLYGRQPKECKMLWQVKWFELLLPLCVKFWHCNSEVLLTLWWVKLGLFLRKISHRTWKQSKHTDLAHNPRVYFQIVLYGCVLIIFETISSAEEMENFMAVFPWFSLPKLQKHFKFFVLVDYFLICVLFEKIKKFKYIMWE